VQRTVLYLGEINDQQQAAWRTTLKVFDEDQQDYRTMSGRACRFHEWRPLCARAAPAFRAGTLIPRTILAAP